ncbi:MAG TPA: tetratricopeptide repeat protein [Syntrophomonadaceae bacterium]|nr:tetratricopeptide repeat protein [Syntrophomonadaceae bacterium]HNX29449.1 tetratricopeptide repeat protein [Syntrophomonadaceae bacterium]HPR93815.1 tetratricopeptide repeat protein [Syntrophomonadaceae bacterium]
MDINQQARQMAYARYLQDPASRSLLHGRLADYLETLPRDNPVRINDLMYHYIQQDNQTRAAMYYGAQLDAAESFAAAAALADLILRGSGKENKTGMDWALALLVLDGIDQTTRLNICSRYLYETGREIWNHVANEDYVRFAVETYNALVTLSRQIPEQGDFYSLLGVALDQMAEKQRSLGYLDNAVLCQQKSLELWREAAQKAGDSPAFQHYQHNLGRQCLDMAGMEEVRGNMEAAEDLYLEGLKIIAGLAQKYSDNIDYQLEVSQYCQHLASFHRGQQHLETAIKYCLDALEVLRLISSADPDRDLSNDLGAIYKILAETERRRLNLDVAMHYYQASLKIARNWVLKYPHQISYQIHLCKLYDEIAELEGYCGNLENARKQNLNSLEIWRKIARENPDEVEYQRGLSVSCDFLAGIERELGDFETAAGYDLESLNIRRRLHQRTPESVDYQILLGLSLENAARNAETINNLELAIKYCQEALDILHKAIDHSPGNDSCQLALVLGLELLAKINVRQEKMDTAREYWRESIDIRADLIRQDPGNIRYREELYRSYERAAMLERMNHDPDGEMFCYKKCLIVMSELALNSNLEDPVYIRDLCASYENMAILSKNQGRLDDAVEYAVQSLEYRRRLAAEHPENVVYSKELFYIYINLAWLEYNRRNLEAALEYNRQADGLAVIMGDTFSSEKDLISEIWSSVNDNRHSIEGAVQRGESRSPTNQAVVNQNTKGKGVEEKMEVTQIQFVCTNCGYVDPQKLTVYGDVPTLLCRQDETPCPKCGGAFKRVKSTRQFDEGETPNKAGDQGKALPWYKKIFNKKDKS